MGKNIGTLGRQRQPLDLEFTYFDNTVIRVHPQATDEVEIDFLEAGKDIDLAELEKLDWSTVDALDPQEQARIFRSMGKAVRDGYLALMSSLRRLIHPDDFESYWTLGQKNGQQLRDRMADIRAITAAVVDATTDFPTGPPSGSPPGRAPTRPSSGAGSPSGRAISDVERAISDVEADLERALALERGRPDIQEFFLMEAEWREQEAREQRERDARDARKLADAGLTPG